MSVSAPSGGFPRDPTTGALLVHNTQDSALDVTGFGAKGDGVTDDTAAINAALAALGGRGRVLFPTGTFVTSGVTLATGQYIEGEGVEATKLLLLAGAAGPLLQSQNFSSLTGTNTTATPFSLGWSQMTLDGNASSAPNAITLPPSISTVTQGGASGATAYYYVATAIGVTGGESVWSVIASTAAGNATLSATNFNIITLGATPAHGWNLYRASVTGGGAQLCNYTRVNAAPINTSTFNDTGTTSTTKLNYADTTVPAVVAMYAYYIQASDFVVRNGAGTGLWTEWAQSSVSPGNDSMESFFERFKVHNCAGDGWVHVGPHDTQSVNAIVFSNGSSTGYAQIRLPSSNGAANGSVISTTHCWGGTSQYGVYCGAAGVRLTSFIAEGGQSAQLWIDAAQVQWDGFLYSGGVSTASVRGVQLGAAGNTVNGTKLFGEIQNCGGGAVDATNGGDSNDIDLHHYYFSGTSPSGATLGVLLTSGSLSPKSNYRVKVHNNSFLPDTSTLHQQVGRLRIVRTQASDTNDLVDIRDDTAVSMYRVDYRGRPRSSAGSTPTVAVGSNIGSGGTVSISGTDHAGTVTITTGTTPAAGQLAVVTFSAAFGATPRAVVLIAKDAAGAAVQYFVTTAASGFSVRCAMLPALTTTYNVDYIVIGS